MPLLAFDIPIEDPILKFLLIMAIVLGAPLVLDRFKIPHLLGLIIAGAVIGPHGLNLVLRDSSIILSGTAGMLYILFLAGIEMDMADFRRNSLRSLLFGICTFLLPMLFGILSGRLLGYPLLPSILMAALFASQTLIAYPIVSKLGITRDSAVTIAVGGTIIVDILALVTLTVVAGIATGNADSGFGYRLAASIAGCSLVILGLFPPLGRRFFKRCSDNTSQYVFVLVMLFLGAYLTQLAGLEPIIGAFLAGLAMNRLIPSTSPLMNRIGFVGEAIFIPFFLLGVGMLIDYHAIFGSWKSIVTGLVMIGMVTAAKWLAAAVAAKSFHLSNDRLKLLFGLSVAHVAGTLAVVMVGYNTILGEAPDGSPLRLLDEAVLNGTILMILATCTISTFVTQRAAHNIALEGPQSAPRPDTGEHVLISVSHPHAVAEAVGLGIAVTKEAYRSLYALNAIDNRSRSDDEAARADKMLDTAAEAAAAAGLHLHRLLRYDVNIVNAIVSVVRERNITDLVLSMHEEQEGSSPFNALGGQTVLGKTIPSVLMRSNVTTYIYRAVQPLSTVRRHLVFVPRRAEMEPGFETWVLRIRHLAHDTGAKLRFIASQRTIDHLQRKRRKADIADYRPYEASWDDLQALFAEVQADDCVWVVMSRRERISYQAAMSRIPAYVENRLTQNNRLLLYPVQIEGREWGI